MLLFAFGASVGVAGSVLMYHFHIISRMKLWGQDWRARALSAEQEVENWKVWAKHKGLDRGY